MAGVTTTHANRELDNYLGGPTLARPTTVYVQLTTTVPTASVAGSAVLSRLAIPNNSINFPAAQNGIKINGTTWAFGATTGQTLSNAVGIDIYDAPTGGNRSYWATIPSVVISDQPAVNIAAGLFRVTRTGCDLAFANRMLDNYLGGPTLVRPATLYAQLTSTLPTATVRGAALLGRFAVTNNATNLPAASSASKANGTAFTFGTTAGQTQPNAAGWEIYDAATGGNRSFIGAIPSVSISDRLTVNFAIGAFALGLT